MENDVNKHGELGQWPYRM